jgi:hypothetical protein
MIEIRFDKTKDEVALLIWFLVDHSVLLCRLFQISFFKGINKSPERSFLSNMVDSLKKMLKKY